MDDAEHMKALVVGESEEPETPIAPMEPWKGEPATIDALLDTHILENKVAGRTPGTTLYLVSAKRRDGEVEGTLPHQKWKLFLVTRLMILLFVHELWNPNQQYTIDQTKPM